MSKVNGYSVYQNNYYNNTVQNKKDKDKTQTALMDAVKAELEGCYGI